MFSGTTPKAEEPLMLEAFDQSLAGHRVMVLGDALAWLNMIATIEYEQLYRGRTVLVIQESKGGQGPQGQQISTLIWKRRWDVVFRVKDAFEAQMLATYVANAPKPIRVIWIGLGGAGEIPRSLWGRWTHDVTLIGCAAQGIVGGVEWECIIFPQGFSTDKMERTLAARGGVQAGVMIGRIRDVISEINERGAGIIWSLIREKTANGSLYWYDTKPIAGNGCSWSKGDVAETLGSISAWLNISP
jgi:hypothetical protein